MKTIVKAGTVDIPAGVTISLKSRIVTVKGPRGEIVKDFKHLPIDLTMADETNSVVEAVLSADTHGKAIQDEINRLEEMDDDGKDYRLMSNCFKLSGIFFWTIFRNIYQLGIVGFLSLGKIP